MDEWQKKNKNFCVEIHCFTLEMEIFFQFFFGDLKKRRIFALAFKETSTVDKTKQKAQENFELFWNMR